MGGGGEAWQWRRGFWVWEEELLAECTLLLNDVPLQPLSFDVWQWLPDPSEGYSIRGVYALLTNQEISKDWQDVDLIWHKQVLLKVSIFAWSLLQDHLPTQLNMYR